MSERNHGKEPRHPIGVVVKRTGIAAEVLRAWERRYNAVVPQRTDTGRRLYSDLDVARLVLMKRAVDAGRRISDVARLSEADLSDLVREDRDAAPVGPPPRTAPAAPGSIAEQVEQCMAAVEDLDHHGLEKALSTASVTLSPARLRQELIVPLMRRIGDRWRDGTLRIVHEHMATAIVRSFLESLRGVLVPPHAPVLVVTTPAGQLHELGALLAANTAAEAGWDAVYLGPSLPADEIAAVSRAKNARALLLSMVYPGHDPHVHEELRRLRRLVGDDMPILVGGDAAESYAETIDEIGAIMTPELDDLRLEIESLAR